MEINHAFSISLANKNALTPITHLREREREREKKIVEHSSEEKK
jgi:hypothetical protein